MWYRGHPSLKASQSSLLGFLDRGAVYSPNGSDLEIRVTTAPTVTRGISRGTIDIHPAKRLRPVHGNQHIWIRGFDGVRNLRIGFKSLAIFRPGIIAGNAHTPSYAAWLGRLIPGPFGTIEQDDIGRPFAAEFIRSSVPNGIVYLENTAMTQRSHGLNSVLPP